MHRFTQFAMPLAAGGLLLYAVLRRFDLRETMASVRDAQPGLLALGLTLMVVAYLLRERRPQPHHRPGIHRGGAHSSTV